MKTILALILLISTNAFGDEWTRGDTYREAAFQTLNIIDWGQTRYIAQNPDRFYEKDYSGLIGSNHPTTERIDIVMSEIAVSHFIISKALVHYGYRTAADLFQYITIGGKLNSAINNASIGIEVSF